MRNAALLCVFLCTFVGLFSAAEALGLGNLSERRTQVRDEASRYSFLADPQVITAMTEAQVSAIESMKTSRGFILGALAVCCALAWVAATRLIRPDGLPREGVRRMLSGSLLFAAVLRTLDGAQTSVIIQKAAQAAVPHLAKAQGADPQTVQLMEQFMPTAMLAWSIFVTVAVAGGLLMLGQYFRSEKVKQVVALQDEQLE